MKLHPNITLEALLAAVSESNFGLENKGFCNACGEEHNGLEPDARNYECEACGKKAVFGAEELLIQTQ